MEWDSAKMKEGDTICLPQDIYKQGCTDTVDEAVAAANRIGFPVMVKASEGGGGKGIRKVNNVDELPNLFRQVGQGWRRGEGGEGRGGEGRGGEVEARGFCVNNCFSHILRFCVANISLSIVPA